MRVLRISGDWYISLFCRYAGVISIGFSLISQKGHESRALVKRAHLLGCNVDRWRGRCSRGAKEGELSA